VQLRDYQIDCVTQLREGYKAGFRRQLLQSPTGSGKTVLFSYVTKGSLERGQTTYILAHRSEILRQISRTLTEVGVEHRMLQAGMHDPKNEKVIVASVATLAKRLNRIKAPDFVIVDEAHHSVASTWATVFGTWVESKFLGVTATPERLDGKGLGDLYDNMVLGPEVSWLIERGFLSPPRYFTPPILPHLEGLKRIGGDFAKNESERAVDRPTITGDAVAQYRKHAYGRKAIAFCVTIAHAVHVCMKFNTAGIPASVIDGNMNDAQRAEIIRNLDSGKILVLVSVDLVSEGFDLPAVYAAILLRPTDSLALHLQQIGRVLRPAKGKDHSLILDHVGNCLRHGLAEETREWTLSGGAKQRRKESEEAALSVHRCSQCYSVFQGPICPNCKTPFVPKERKIEQVDGDLVELQKSKLERMKEFRKQQSDCRSLKDFVRLAKEPGWAYMKWKNSWQRRAIENGQLCVNTESALPRSSSAGAPDNEQSLLTLPTPES